MAVYSSHGDAGNDWYDGLHHMTADGKWAIAILQCCHTYQQGPLACGVVGLLLGEPLIIHEASRRHIDSTLSLVCMKTGNVVTDTGSQHC